MGPAIEIIWACHCQNGFHVEYVNRQDEPHNSMSSNGYPKFKNDHGIQEIRIGAKEFLCIGASPPQDHPHIYLSMGDARSILCPYCGTRFRFDPLLSPTDADPPESLLER